MKITRITSEYYAWPRSRPISNAAHTWSEVKRCVVKVETDEGIIGIGVGGASAGEKQFRDAFAESIDKQSAFNLSSFPRCRSSKLHAKHLIIPNSHH